MALSHSPSIVTDGLVLYLDAANPKSYPGTGTGWFDLSGGNNNGNLINGPAFNSANQGFIRCDGTNDYIEVLDSSSLDFGANNFTVEYWFKKLANTSGGYNNIWGPNKWNTGASPGTNEWFLCIGNGTLGNSNSFSFGIESNSNTNHSTGESTTLLDVNMWYQLVGVREGATLKTYLNGIINQNISPSGMTSGTQVANRGRNLRLCLNAFLSGSPLFTNVDNAIVRIYNRALTLEQIQHNFNAHRGRFGI
jgi:hypothetical protein